jgi:hypothetical protein
MLVPACGSRRAREGASSEAEVSPRARRNPLEGGVNPRARRNPLEGGVSLSYGPPWAHYLGGYQDRLLGGPLGLPGLRYMAPEDVEHKDYAGVVLG